MKFEHSNQKRTNFITIKGRDRAVEKSTAGRLVGLNVISYHTLKNMQKNTKC